MIPLLVRHEGQVLLNAGHTQADVARRRGASARTARRGLEDAPVAHVDDQAERRARRVGPPSKAAAFTEEVRGWLAKDVRPPTQELPRRAKEAGHRGCETAFYGRVAGLRPPRAGPVVRFEGLPGESSQQDFGQAGVASLDGREPRVRFSASRLKCSRDVRVTRGEDERVETNVRCPALDLAAFGGWAAADGGARPAAHGRE